MKLASTLSALLLLLGGILGLVNIFDPLNIVLSVYNILLALLILSTELKTWPLLASLNRKVDVYFHLLSSQKGKGGFYIFIGVLAFFARKNWDVTKVCILIVAIVGFFQLLEGCVSGDSAPGEAGAAPALASQDVSSVPQPPANPFLSAVQNNPAMIGSALSYAASNPGAVSAVTGAFRS